MIWYVDFNDLTCAWTERQDAINYVHEEAKRLQVKDIKVIEGSEEDLNYGYIIYAITFENNNSIEVEIVTIKSIFLDKKPYWD